MKILHTADWHIGQFKGPVVDGVNLRSQDTVKCFPSKRFRTGLDMNHRKQPGKFMLICIQEKTGSLLTLSMK